MRLSNVRIQNFRAIEDLSLDLQPGLNVLVGDNGAGKSSVLDAIAVALAPIAQALGRKAGISMQRADIRFDGRRTLPYYLIALTSADGRQWDRMRLKDRSAATLRQVPPPGQRRGVAGLRAWLADLELIDILGGSSTLPVVAYYGTDRAVLEVPLRRRNFRAEFSRKQAFEGALNASSRFKTVFEWFLAKEYEELRGQKEREDFAYHLPDLAAVRTAIESVIPGARDLRVEERPMRMVVTLRNQAGRDEDLTLSQLSGGYRTLLALVADLARRMVQANPDQGLESEAVVLIDEVDLHLHPKWQQTVLDDLAHTFPKAQFIVATHSEQVIAGVRAECVFRLDRADGGVHADQPTSTFGATSDRILEDVLAVPRRRENVQDLLDRYWAHIKRDEGEGPAARTIRQELERWFQGQDPEMVRADIEIHRRAVLRGNRE